MDTVTEAVGRIDDLVQTGTVASVLFYGSTNRQDVVALQQILFELGFSAELRFKTYGFDGIYGKSTKEAVMVFARKNQIDTDGHQVTREIGALLLSVLGVLKDLTLLCELVTENRVENSVCEGGQDRAAICAAQKLLHVFGYDKELQWGKYGADGYYGASTAKALAAFAGDRKLPCETAYMTGQLASGMIRAMESRLGENWEGKPISPVSSSSLAGISIQPAGQNISKNCVSLTDGTCSHTFVVFKKGYYSTGKIKVSDFIQNNRTWLVNQGLSESSLNVADSVSINEGHLDAVNTWDNSFLSFGMFQWTAGASQSKGELPALMNLVQKKDPKVFASCYGEYGLGVAQADQFSGYLSLDGTVLRTPEQKETLRSGDWAFVFWKSGQNPVVQSVEIEHAISRIDCFYRNSNSMVENYYICDLVSSEYGVALLLDNSVNRPGYLVPCLNQAFSMCGLKDPETWTTEEEKTFLSAYLVVRADYGHYPMTDSDKRASNIEKLVQEKRLSAERGSFSYEK